MGDHPHQLYAVEFTEADQARLVGFSCGDELWSRHVAEWIRGSDVVDSMKRGTRVWLFETTQGEVVGFGSVGTSEWRWPPPKGSKATIVLIPMLGIAFRFRGDPPDPDWRYSGYERCGFELISDVIRRKEHLVMKLRLGK